MSSVVVWLTKGGIVEYVATPDTDVLVIDFQNLEAGDHAPEMSEAHRALLTNHAPTVLNDIARYSVHYRCDNCDMGFRSVNELNPVVDQELRVAPGEAVPVGECPECGAVVHPVTDDWWPVPVSAIERHYLSGQFFLSSEAWPRVQEIGLDRVLAWFGTTRHVIVGDSLPIGDFGLIAYFGIDPEKPNGECCYVRISILR